MLFTRKKYLIVLLAFLVGASVMSIRQSSLAASEIHANIGNSMTLDFTVVTDPKKIKNGKISLIAKTKGVPVRVIGFGDEYLPSAKFRATGKLLVSKEPRVAALFISWKKFKVIDNATWWQQKLGNIRKGLREAAKSEPLIPGMVLGDTSLQSVEFSDAMRRSGLLSLIHI